ncbi:hypothetical protein ACOZDZ_21570, partial [Streptomyces griseoincarnatus]
MDYHTFELADSDKRVPTGFDTSNGLVFSLPGQVVICTGISAGWVTVSVEVGGGGAPAGGDPPTGPRLEPPPDTIEIKKKKKHHPK